MKRPDPAIRAYKCMIGAVGAVFIEWIPNARSGCPRGCPRTWLLARRDKIETLEDGSQVIEPAWPVWEEVTVGLSTCKQHGGAKS